MPFIFDEMSLFSTVCYPKDDFSCFFFPAFLKIYFYFILK